MSRIGKKTPCEIRSVWRTERDFSRWLATEPGVGTLDQDIALQVENMVCESKIGAFPCDLAGNLVGDEEHIVVIENQFGKTDHDHLGKLLTHVSLHRAMTGIWIAERAADDHRQVVEWLNENTPTSANFYLLEVAIFRIGESDPAPQLSVVCRPNERAKARRSGLSESENELQEWQRSTWESIHEAIRRSRPPFNLQKASGQHWSSITVGRTGFHIAMLLNTRKPSIGIEMYMTVAWKDRAFQSLRAKETEIEREVGSKLDWMPLPEKKAARILLENEINPRDPEKRTEVTEWFATNLLKMYDVFKPRIARLRAPQEAPK